MKICPAFKTVLAVCLLLFISQTSFSQDSTISYLSDPDGRIREHNVDFIKMVLDVKFKEKEGKVIGNVKYDFKLIQFVVDTLFLNAPGIDIKKVLLDGKETQFTTDSTGVTIKFMQAMNWNKQYKLEISYEATPRKGLYFIGWNVDDKNIDKDFYYTRKQIWTQGQGIDNRHCAEVIDHEIHTRPRCKLADCERFGILAQAHRRRLIFEVARRAPLVGDGRALGSLVHAPFGVGEIDRSRRVVGKNRVADATLNRRRTA